MKKPKLLILSDSLLHMSGVGRMTKNITLGIIKDFDIVQIAASPQDDPNIGKILDLSQTLNKDLSLTDCHLKLYPIKGFGNPNLLRDVIKLEKPNIILHFTDPRRWEWLYQMEHEIRQQMPITYYHVWDNFPSPDYNKSYYESCDSIMCISQLTKQIVEDVTDKLALPRNNINYIPHGINTDLCFPITTELRNKNLDIYTQTEQKLIGDKQYDFVLLFNNRNILRKNVPDIIESYSMLINSLTKKQASGTLLVLKTKPTDQNGSNLIEVIDKLQKTTKHKMNVSVIDSKLTDVELNILYNLSDVVINVASQEGWGLSSTEAMATGTMIINNVTGGLQDQCRFSNIKDEWVSVIKTKDEFNTLNYGSWCVPIYPITSNMIGSQPTPYLYDDRISTHDLFKAMEKVYNLDDKQRTENGLNGRLWLLKDESNFTLSGMSNRINKELKRVLKTWKPKEKIKLIKF